MATLLWRKQGEAFYDADGNPLAGGKLRYDRAGTTTLLTTYSDAAGTTPNTQTSNRVILDAAGRLEEPVYIDDSFDVKETLFTSADVIVDPWPFDHIPKAVDLAASLSDFAKPRVEWATPDTAATVNLTTANMGGGRIGDTSSNSITYNLPSASAAGNGKSITIKKSSASNSITVDGDGSETIDGSTTFSWTEDGRTYTFISDGANWQIGDSHLSDFSDGFINGLTEDTNPHSDNDFVPTYDANATGNKKVPLGMLPGALIAIIEDNKAQNTDGGTFTSGADQTRTLNTLVYNRDNIVTLGSDQFTLPAGTWEIEWSAPAARVSFHQSFLYDATNTTEIKRGTSLLGTNDDPNVNTRSFGSARVSHAGSVAYEIRHRCSATFATTGFGNAANFGTEVYTRVTVRRA